MQLRDRRGPFAALLVAIAYVCVTLVGALELCAHAGLIEPTPVSPSLKALLTVTLAAFLWRAVVRAAFTTREYGLREGLLAVPRMFISNIIAIMAGRRAVASYARSLRGAPVLWDKTEHSRHPATQIAAEAAA